MKGAHHLNIPRGQLHLQECQGGLCPVGGKKNWLMLKQKYRSTRLTFTQAAEEQKAKLTSTLVQEFELDGI